MSRKHIVNRLFIDNGVIDVPAVEEHVPANFEIDRSSQEDYEAGLTDFAYSLVSRVKLPLGFIRGNFEHLHFHILINSNVLPEDLLIEKYDHIAELIHSSEYGEMIIQSLFEYEFSTDVFDKIIGGVFDRMETMETRAKLAAVINETIHENVDSFSHDFILENVCELGFELLTASLFRDDITDDDLIENIDLISYDSIYRVLFAFEKSLEAEDEDEDYTEEKHIRYKAILLHKLERDI